MPPDYASVFAKLGRAEEHFKIVDSEIRRWAEGNAYFLTPEFGIKTNRYGLVANMVGTPPDLLRWTLMVGDTINNLRSSLDHLVYAIAKYQTANDPSAKIDHLAFVIADTDAEFDDWKRSRLKHLSSGVVDAIKSVQPYNRRNATIPPALAILSDFSNTDKHRLLRLAFASVTEWNLNLAGPTDVHRSIHFYPGEVTHDTVVCVIESDKPDPYLTVHSGNIGLSIALWHDRLEGNGGVMADRSDYCALLNLLICEVKFVIDTVIIAADRDC